MESLFFILVINFIALLRRTRGETEETLIFLQARSKRSGLREGVTQKKVLSVVTK